jgi:hypothetical protein
VVTKKLDEIAEILHCPSSPNPFSQAWEKGGKSTKRSLLIPLLGGGEGWGEGKCNEPSLKLISKLLPETVKICRNFGNVEPENSIDRLM